MKEYRRKKIKTWQYLLMIPVIFIIDIIGIVLACYADVAIADTSSLGHPAPFITMIAFFLLALITLIVLLLAIILTIRGFVKKKRMEAQEWTNV